MMQDVILPPENYVSKKFSSLVRILLDFMERTKNFSLLHCITLLYLTKTYLSIKSWNFLCAASSLPSVRKIL